MKKLLFFALAVTALSSCSKDNNDRVENAGNFVLAVTPVAQSDAADYLLTASSLDTGRVSTTGQGIEQDGTYRYYLTHNNKFFSFLYGQGNPGAVTTYNIVGGKLNKLSNFQTETVQAFAPVNDDILLLKIPRSNTTPVANFYTVNTNSLLITKEGTINTTEPSKNGEIAFYSSIKQVGNKVYAPYLSVKGCCNESFGTAYPDSAWVAVYSYPEMKLEKVIKDDRTSFIGRYFTEALALDEQGDIYAFSSSVATTGGKFSSTKPSSITRIKAGTTEFDKSFLFDIEAVAAGKNITNWIYVGNGNFVVQLTTKEEKGAYNNGKHLGIVNVYNKTYRDVTGTPDLNSIKSVAVNNYTNKDGNAYIGFALKDGTSYVYKVNANSAVATKGLRVEGGVITAVSRVN